MKQLKERIPLITDTAGIILGLLTCQGDKCHLINVFFVIAMYCGGAAVLKLPVSKPAFELDIESCLSAALSLIELVMAITSQMQLYCIWDPGMYCYMVLY